MMPCSWLLRACKYNTSILYTSELLSVLVLIFSHHDKRVELDTLDSLTVSLSANNRLHLERESSLLTAGRSNRFLAITKTGDTSANNYLDLDSLLFYIRIVLPERQFNYFILSYTTVNYIFLVRNEDDDLI